MPISYTIDLTRALVDSVATGVLTVDDILEHKARLDSDPRFSPTMCEIADVRDVERIDVTPAGISRVVWADQKEGDQPAGHRLAIVVSSDVAYGLGRMYQLQTSPTDERVKIFRDREEAETWLGLR